MEDHRALLERIVRLEAIVASQAARIEEQAATIAGQAAVIRTQAATIEAQATTIADLERELRERGKKYVPKANAPPKTPKPDRRKGEFRTHPGKSRPLPDIPRDVFRHDVIVETCPCGGVMTPTGRFSEHIVEDIPEPRIEVHLYRRHVCRCGSCGSTAQGRNDLAVPGSHLGPRVKLLTAYARARLGISLGKTTALVEELYGLRFSTAAACGHLGWFAKRFDPVVTGLLDVLRTSDVVHADETGWRINGKNVWCWCFSNPTLAVFLIDRSRSAAVVREALGDSLPGVLVTDFYAAYHAIECRKQRCLVHLLRDLRKLRDELPAAQVARHIRPVMELFQNAISLANRRGEMTPEEFELHAAAIKHRFDETWWRQSIDPDCQRIYKRLRRHKDELLTFLEKPAVPPDNNAAERDIRSVAATRADGGINRTDWGAKAFGIAKSIVRTCRKNGLNFFAYGLAALKAIAAGRPPDLPLAHPPPRPAPA